MTLKPLIALRFPPWQGFAFSPGISAVDAEALRRALRSPAPVRAEDPEDPGEPCPADPTDAPEWIPLRERPPGVRVKQAAESPQSAADTRGVATARTEAPTSPGVIYPEINSGGVAHVVYRDGEGRLKPVILPGRPYPGSPYAHARYIHGSEPIPAGWRWAMHLWDPPGGILIVPETCGIAVGTPGDGGPLPARCWLRAGHDGPHVRTGIQTCRRPRLCQCSDCAAVARAGVP